MPEQAPRAGVHGRHAAVRLGVQQPQERSAGQALGCYLRRQLVQHGQQHLQAMPDSLCLHARVMQVVSVDAVPAPAGAMLTAAPVCRLICALPQATRRNGAAQRG